MYISLNGGLFISISGFIFINILSILLRLEEIIILPFSLKEIYPLPSYIWTEPEFITKKIVQIIKINFKKYKGVCHDHYSYGKTS